jgi:hypothetical protein
MTLITTIPRGRLFSIDWVEEVDTQERVLRGEAICVALTDIDLTCYKNFHPNVDDELKHGEQMVRYWEARGALVQIVYYEGLPKARMRVSFEGEGIWLAVDKVTTTCERL